MWYKALLYHCFLRLLGNISKRSEKQVAFFCLFTVDHLFKLRNFYLKIDICMGHLSNFGWCSTFFFFRKPIACGNLDAKTSLHLREKPLTLNRLKCFLYNNKHAREEATRSLTWLVFFRKKPFLLNYLFQKNSLKCERNSVWFGFSSIKRFHSKHKLLISSFS